MIISELRKKFQSRLLETLAIDSSMASLEADLIILSEIDPESQSRARLIMSQKDLCDPETENKLNQKLERRVLGEPLAYITNSKEFYSHTFYVDPNVLIPRPETEMLVSECLRIIESFSNDKIGIIDLGSGSGAIILSVLHELKNDKRYRSNTYDCVAVELSEGASQVISKNALQLGLLSDVEIINSCMFSFLSSERYLRLVQESDFVIILSNPPYLDREDAEISPDVRAYEPDLALFSNNEGYQHIIKIIDMITAIYMCSPQPNSRTAVLIEIGYNQADRLLSYAHNFNDFKIEVLRDLAGLNRVFSLSQILDVSLG